MRLTTYLLSRILLSATVVLAVVLLWLVVAGHRAAVSELEHAASSMERILEMQFVGLTQSAGLEPVFPDWYPVTQVARPDGTCVRLLSGNDELVRSECRGQAPAHPRAPAWFAHMYAIAFAPGDVIQREIDGGEDRARIELVPTEDVEIVAAWREVRTLAVPAALVIGVLCLTVWWSVRRALTPAAAIMSGLLAIERGALDTRLGPYSWVEFDRIASACNTLAASLAASQAARVELSRRLHGVQEEERHALARELHDEFGQYLSAISANAAALRAAPDTSTCGEDARRIEDGARHLMQLVRGMLLRLRPWTAGDADLEQSLRALAVDGGAAGNHRPCVAFELAARLDDLPDALAGAVYRIVQEALTNARRHAAADSVVVNLTRKDDTLQLSIADDGLGCDPGAVAGGFGAAGIRERAAAFGGQATFHRNEEGGLTVTVVFPNVIAPAVAA